MHKDTLLKYKIADSIDTVDRSNSDIVKDVLDSIEDHGYMLITKEEFNELKEYEWMYKQLSE